MGNDNNNKKDSSTQIMCWIKSVRKGRCWSGWTDSMVENEVQSEEVEKLDVQERIKGGEVLHWR